MYHTLMIWFIFNVTTSFFRTPFSDSRLNHWWYTYDINIFKSFQQKNGSQISINIFDSNALINKCVYYISEKLKVVKFFFKSYFNLPKSSIYFYILWSHCFVIDMHVASKQQVTLSTQSALCCNSSLATLESRGVSDRLLKEPS